MCQLDNKLKANRITVWSGDRFTGNRNDFKVRLPQPLRNVVLSDWTSCSLQFEAVAIDELGNTCTTTNGAPYWSFLSDYSNYFPLDANTAPQQGPKFISELSIKVLDPGGVFATIGNEWYIELILYTRE